MASGRARPTQTGGNLTSRAPTPTNRTRASHRNTVSLLIPKDEILHQEYDVKDKESSIIFLEKSPFCQSGEPISNESLILTILHITQYTGIPRIVIEGLRAVAILLEDVLLSGAPTESPTHQISESFSTLISTQIIADLTTSLSTHVIAAISPQIATILTASESLKSNIDDLAKLNNALEVNSKHANENPSAMAAATRAEQTADAVMNSITDVKKAIESLTPSISATQSSIKQISQDLISNADRTSSPQAELPKTYSAIVQQSTQTPGTVSAAIARAATRDKTNPIRPDPRQKIASEIKKAITATETEDTPDIQIKATTRLRNGGLIIELTTTEAAKWIRNPVNRLRIIDAIGIPATIKERRFSVIVPFLPITATWTNQTGYAQSKWK
ncbi:hypothetical protein DEU56DRAFT_947116 [Suillus clintonianus]|uniref:uncharacterized protein n=1 Tax=Suillus clintonianus TaxID=1904413 RepID=UPI001B868676|nr:uncharacterized protein DEU56DRAFT_947116 [Suillus clintonianus]KAG2135956.1 hypothetical protein DEU56DRAFT_947116 [Suillus clintonianus]